jgi:3-hydroxyacyl-CoA dehydrogenase
MIDYSVDHSTAYIRLDNPPLNVLSYPLLDELVASLDRAGNDASVNGIILYGSETHFTAGADVAIFRKLETDDEAIAVSKRFQDVFMAIEQSVKPVVAAVAGSVMGGALECALSAHFRVCTATTRFSLPEVNLGIVSGAGGTQRLPRTTGVAPALDMLLSGKPVSAAGAFEMGLVDAVCAPSEFLTKAAELLSSGKNIVRTSVRTDMIADSAANETAFSEAEKLLRKTPPELIARKIIIDAVKTGISSSFAEGCRKEQTGFAACMATNATCNKINLFFATRSTGKVEAYASFKPAEITTTAVIGMGSMGSGIAQAFAAAGKQVIVLDTDRGNAEKGIVKIADSMTRKINRGSMTRDKADALLKKITIADGWRDLSGADLVIEAVYEDIGLKQSILNNSEEACPPETIIASNTSTIDLDTLAQPLTHPQRLIGLHFFNPAHSMPLVEVIKRESTAPEVVASALHFAGTIKKTAILVNNSVGFVVNRLFIPYAIEAYRLLEEGADPFAVDAAMVKFGFPMGPLAIIDMTGIDILAFTDMQMHSAFPWHIPLSEIAKSLISEGMLGQKSGCGVYRYEKGNHRPLANERTVQLVKKHAETSGIPLRTFTDEEITDRLIFRLIAEGFRVVEEGIARNEQDMDVAMVLGIGFPDFRGGVLRYAREYGLKAVVDRLMQLTTDHGERYSPCKYLQSIIQE